jgi:hypothetical protein
MNQSRSTLNDSRASSLDASALEKHAAELQEASMPQELADVNTFQAVVSHRVQCILLALYCTGEFR